MNSPRWLLLVINLPGRKQTPRMRIWRRLKSAGAGSLRDGVYLLPDTQASRQTFTEQVTDVHESGGVAQLVVFQSDSATQATSLQAYFDRTPDYVRLNARVDAFRRQLVKSSESHSRRLLGALQRAAAALVAIDFFSGKSRLQMEEALVTAETAIRARFSGDEPHASSGTIRRCKPSDYSARVWATRERLWIDRVCSAWLIRRFVDRKAKFKWLKRVADCPKSAVGFDFDGAQFTHVGSKVTFEVLLTSFALDQDAALLRMAALVHFLDVGGIPVAEAAGL